MRGRQALQARLHKVEEALSVEQSAARLLAVQDGFQTDMA